MGAHGHQQRRVHEIPLFAQSILDTRWARGDLFRELATDASAAVVPEPYIAQSVFASGDREAQPLILGGSGGSLTQLFATQRRALLIARSGTGKSVFLHHLQREVAARFRRGERVPLPVLTDLRTHVLSGRAVQDLVRDTLRGGGVELVDGDLDFLIGKGRLLILVDS